jgi:hypothetical protein
MIFFTYMIKPAKEILPYPWGSIYLVNWIGTWITLSHEMMMKKFMGSHDDLYSCFTLSEWIVQYSPVDRGAFSPFSLQYPWT